MSKVYCLRIKNPDKREISREDLNELTEFVRNLYIRKSDDTSKISFLPYYSETNDSICIRNKGRSRANIENIEKINSILENEDLEWKYNIYLENPEEFENTQVLSFDVTSGRKWDSIVQQGPYFTEIMEPYKRLGASLFLRGTEYKLKAEEEKVARFYAERKITEEKDNITKTYTRPIKNETEDQRDARELFNQNFWKDFKTTYLSADAKKIFKTEQDFLDIDWSDLIQKIRENKQKDDKDTKDRKDAEKVARYGYATLNGVPFQKLSNFSVEKSGIFYGVGANKRLGRIKKQVLPEDVTLNLGENDPIPLPPDGHEWGGIAHHHDLEWLATWKDKITGGNKYIWFSPEGAFKAQSDIIKYEKARKLHRQLDRIRTQYMEDANSSNKRSKQLGTVLYLIDHFGIRVGNEKDEDEAETVGATTLLFENVDLDYTNKRVIFNFLGKDSVPYQKELEVDPIIFNNFQLLLKYKRKDNDKKQIFEITSEDINKYLKQFDEDFSAKVFRTRLANDIMYHALQTVEIPDKPTNRDIKFNFAKANVEVAKVLNHSRSPSINALEALEKMKTDLETAKITKDAKSKKDLKKIKTLTDNIASKENGLSVAINTSLTNYIDPRLVISWAKTKEVSPNVIYTAKLLNKFKWAVERTEEGWDWENSPLEDINEEDKKKPARAPPSTGKSAKKTQPVRAPPPSAGKSAKKTPPVRAPPPSAGKSAKKTPLVRAPPPSAGKSAKKTPPVRAPPPSAGKSAKKTPLVRAPPPSAEKSTERTPPKDPFFGELRSDRIEDYQLLLRLCRNFEKHKDKIGQLNRDVLDWIYPFCKEAVERGVTIEATKFIVDYYEKHNLLKRPEDDTPVAENVRKPDPESSDDEDAPPISPPVQNKKIQKAKIQKAPRTYYIVPSDDVDFIFLNTHNNEGILRKYCKKHRIPIKPEHNIDQIKLAIIKFYKDNPAKPISWN